MKYECMKCRHEFFVEEAKGAKYVTSVSKCTYCKSRKIERTSNGTADVEVWMCRQCNGYMVRKD